MNVEEHIKYWLESAGNDILVADNLFNSGNFNWCLFIGHLVIEKALKAHFVKNNDNKIPPKIHDLIRLSELSEIAINEETKKFFFILNKFNLEARYPEYKNEIFKISTLEFTSEKLQKIKEVFNWLKSLI